MGLMWARHKAHVRRGFYDLAKAKAPIAIEALQRIAALYEVEARVRGKTAAERQAESKPLVAELRIWFDAQIAKLPARRPMAEAIRYALNHRDRLQRFLDDGRIERDSNNIERAMRPISLSRKNSLFAGSDEGAENWACLASLIETCKLNGINPQAYFTDLLIHLVNGWPQNGIDELMPWHWATKQPPGTSNPKGGGTTLTAAATLAWSNGQTKGHVNRLKTIKRQMYGRANLDLLGRRFLLAA